MPSTTPRPNLTPLLNRGGTVLAFLLLVGVAACDLPRAHGDVHALVVGADAGLWEAMELEVEEAIAPTIQVVRDEATFRVTWQDPEDPDWSQLRRFRNMVVIGAPEDPWVAEALATRSRDAAPVGPGEIVRVEHVWARGQGVTVVVLPASDDTETLATLLPELGRFVDREYRDWAVNRMFSTPRNESLADSLQANVGFRMVFPQVYRYSVLDDVFRFRNDNPSPAELIREVGVTWSSPIPEELPGPDEIIAWRQAFSETYYNDPQVVDTVLTSFRSLEVPGSDRPGVEFQAAWVSPPDAWPAGGPTLTRVIPCPEQDRLYWLDAWLYAPSRGKYEYMIQLETILDSFRCG